MEKEATIEVTVKDSVLEVFLKALTEKYTGDSKEAGLTIAWIPERQEFYAAVNRFPNQSAARVSYAYGATLTVAIRNCINKWKRIAGVQSEDNLEKLKSIEL